LTHYRNLIRCRISRDKQMRTQYAIIQALKDNGKAPGYQDFLSLRESVDHILPACEVIELVENLVSLRNKVNVGGEKFHFYYSDDFHNKPLEKLHEGSDAFQACCEHDALMIGRPVLSKTQT